MPLASLFARRGITEPDGRPLFAYRVSPAESAAFLDYLKNELKTPRSRYNKVTAQIFCIWAADFWCRSYRSGNWAWDTVVREVDAPHLATGSAHYAALQRLVRDGIEAWGRSLVQGSSRNEYLKTLGCEGGLPLQLVKQEQGALRSYFTALFREFQANLVGGRLAGDLTAEGLAEHVEDYLPKGLRQPVVFELAGRLVIQIFKLLEKVRDAANPVASLDQIDPEWREKMPITLADDVASAFLNRLVLDAATAIRTPTPPIRWVRRLRRAKNEVAEADGSRESISWVLEASLQFPRRMPADELANVFSAGELPARFELATRDERGVTKIRAIATVKVENGKQSDVWFRAAATEARSAEAQSAVAETALVLQDPRANIPPSFDYPGALALSELPWVFAPVTEGSTNDYELVGEGSFRTRAPEVLVAVAEGWTIDEGTSVPELRGGLTGTAHRSVYAVGQETIFVSESGDRCGVRPGIPTPNELASHRLAGPRQFIGRDELSVFLGLPILYHEVSGGIGDRVPDEELEWKSALHGRAFSHADSTARGDGQLRRKRQGEILFSTRITVLPRGFRTSVTPGPNRSGTLEISGLGGASVEPIPVSGISCTAIPSAPDSARFALAADGAPPPSVKFRVLWPRTGEVTFALAYPAEHTQFERFDGVPLPRETRVAATQLSYLRATAIAPTRFDQYTVRGILARAHPGNGSFTSAAFVEPLRQGLDGVSHVSLDLLRARVLESLSSSDDLDDSVRLTFESGGPLANGPTLLVTRYDLSLSTDRSGTFTLPLPDATRLKARELEALELRAFPLADPTASQLVLSRGEEGDWLFPNPAPQGGPWIVAGWDGDWCRARPTIHAAVGPEPVYHPGGLAEACSILEERARAPRIAEAVAQLASNPQHPDWSLVLGYLTWSDQIPAATFDALREVVRQPQAAATLALHLACGSDSEFERGWRALQTLPFAWTGLSRSTWESALVIWLRSWQSLSTRVSGSSDANIAVPWFHQRPLQKIAESRMKWLQPVFEEMAFKELAIPISLLTRFIGKLEFLKTSTTLFCEDRDSLSLVAVNATSLPASSAVTARQEAVSAQLKSDKLFVAKHGHFQDDRKRNFVNAPMVAAACSVLNVSLDAQSMVQLRAIEIAEPLWFERTYGSAYLHVLARQMNGQFPESLQAEGGS